MKWTTDIQIDKSPKDRQKIKEKKKEKKETDKELSFLLKNKQKKIKERNVYVDKSFEWPAFCCSVH